MAQAVELMEETVAAEKRKRERRAASPEATAQAPEASSSEGEATPGVPSAG
jgi:hypothetical protein